MVPIRDYFFRYDRGAFWMGSYGFAYFPFVPFDRLSRFVLDRLLHTRVMYRAMHESGHYDYHLIQDLGVPCGRAVELMEFTGRGKGIWPLWLCPLKMSNGTKLLKKGAVDFSLPPRKRRMRDDGNNGHADANGQAETNGTDASRNMIFNIGVWGPAPSRKYSDFVAANRAIERHVSELGGIKWPYSQYFYTEDEFWSLYDKEAYDALRVKYGATGLPTMYDKVRPRERREDGPPNAGSGVKGWILRKLWHVGPVSALYGIAKALLGREARYLVSKEG
ncbi:MAG: hypothetical protein INR71_16400 [Terriglobus roseus]|nr:hypothetical protein [Terriglobus roseus]